MFADEPVQFIVAVLLIPLVIGIVWLAWWYLKHRTTTLTVADDRVTLSRGILSKERIEIELDRIRSVQIDQTLTDRLFDCGVVRIYTAGDRPEIEMRGMPDPERLRIALRH